MDAAKIHSVTRASLSSLVPSNRNGKDFYKHLFTTVPDLRKYFKGAENFTADDVEKSDRFGRQGEALLMSLYVLSDTITDPVAFKAFSQDLAHRHVPRNVGPDLFAAFFPVLLAFLATKGAVSDETKTAWTELAHKFVAETKTI